MNGLPSLPNVKVSVRPRTSTSPKIASMAEFLWPRAAPPRPAAWATASRISLRARAGSTLINLRALNCSTRRDRASCSPISTWKTPPEGEADPPRARRVARRLERVATHWLSSADRSRRYRSHRTPMAGPGFTTTVGAVAGRKCSSRRETPPRRRDEPADAARSGVIVTTTCRRVSAAVSPCPSWCPHGAVFPGGGVSGGGITYRRMRPPDGDGRTGPEIQTLSGTSWIRGSKTLGAGKRFSGAG